MIEMPAFLKWAGGKRRLISQIDPHLPEKIDTYYEPFLGAGSMFFYIKQKYNPKNCIISDINKDLINTFIAVRDNPHKLMKLLEYYIENNSEEFYYDIRKKYNDRVLKRLNRCAAFIYLNKTCFNGIYRLNLKGEFNVPYGKKKNPEIFNQANILLASKLLQGVVIKHQDYQEILSDAGEGDFVYLDPCYDPLKKTSFTKYTEKRFTEEDSEKLRVFITQLKNFGSKVLLSNNFVDSIRYRYPLSEGYEWHVVYSPRCISSKSTGRGKIKEYLIKAGY